MGIVLFDWESTSTTKKVINTILSNGFLFDCYLTELRSYQHSTQMLYLSKF